MHATQASYNTRTHTHMSMQPFYSKRVMCTRHRQATTHTCARTHIHTHTYPHTSITGRRATKRFKVSFKSILLILKINSTIFKHNAQVSNFHGHWTIQLVWTDFTPPHPTPAKNKITKHNTVTCTKHIRETVSPIRIAASKTPFIVRVQGETDDFHDSEIFAQTCSVIVGIWSMAALNRGSSKWMTADDSNKLKEQSWWQQQTKRTELMTATN